LSLERLSDQEANCPPLCAREGIGGDKMTQ
jgi:hypothetical protein